MVEIEIGTNEKGQRFDRFLRKYLPGAPLSYIYKIVRKDAKVNGRRAKDVYILGEGDIVTLYLNDEELNEFRRKEKGRTVRKTFSTAYEDEHILIADKPAGILTHGDRTEKREHLTNQVQSYLISRGDFDASANKTFAPSPVNRLDRNTSGLVIFAKDYDALKKFNELIRSRENIRKIYVTAVLGELGEEIMLDGMIEKNEGRNISRMTSEAGAAEKTRRAVTHVRPIECGAFSGKTFTLAEVEIETGRTHQIRVQLSEAGYPIAGDPKYGDQAANEMLRKRFGLTHQLLTAERLEFGTIEGYPEISGKTVKAKLPKIFRRLIDEIERGENRKEFR